MNIFVRRIVVGTRNSILALVSIFGRRTVAETRNSILTLLDLENILRNSIIVGPAQLFITKRFSDVLAEIAIDVGHVETHDVFVFSPPYLASSWAGLFYTSGFFTFICPDMREKDGKTVNTTDDSLKKFGDKQSRRGYSHLCLVSGDKHFAPLAKEARVRGMKIIVLASSRGSAAGELLNEADKKPNSSERMIYYISPEEQKMSA